MAVRRRKSTGRFAALVLVCAACSSSPSTDIKPAGDDSLVALVESHCTDLAAPGLGEGTLCVDSGFRPDVDDFSFTNWGRSAEADANVTIQTLVDLFGRAAVCAPGPETECILRPATVQRLEEWNNALAGGRCEGFAALSARFLLGMERPSDYRRGAVAVADLRRSDARLEQALAYWWATQFLPEVTDRAAQSRTRSPLALVDEIIVGLAGGLGLTLGLYDEGTGHAVVPFAVTRRNDVFVVHVYDNNHPGERREVLVDSSTNSWTYPRAVRGADATWNDWSGATGSIEITPMSARQGPFRCDFCTSLPDSADTEISIASREPSSPGRLRIVSTAGTFAVTATGIDNSIEGATWRTTKGGASNLIVTIPASAGGLDVSVTREVASVPAGDVVIGVRRPGNPDLQVQGNLASASADAAPVLLVRDEGTTVLAPAGATARVSIASETGLSRTTVDAGGELLVRTIAKDAIEVSLKGVGVARLVDDKDHVERTINATDNALTVETAIVAPVPITVQQRHNFDRDTSTTIVSSTVPSTTPATDPDDGPAPSIVVTLPD